MTIGRTTAGINKAADAAARYLKCHDSFRQESTEPSGLIVVWQMRYPVQYALGAPASMASSATFRGILLRASSVVKGGGKLDHLGGVMPDHRGGA